MAALTIAFLYGLQRMLRRVCTDGRLTMALSPSDRALGDLLVGAHHRVAQLDEAVHLPRLERAPHRRSALACLDAADDSFGGVPFTSTCPSSIW